MQLFYTIKSSQRLLLIQQILGDEISQPVVVSSLEDINCPFFAVADANQDTYIYYQSKNGAFGYKIYKWSSKALGEFSAITKEPCSNIYALIDMYNRHHICCLCQEGAMYIQRSLDGKYIKKSYVSCLHSQSDAAPYISLEEEKIYIVWQQKHCVMYSVSNNDGESFCAPVRIISSGEAPSLFSVQNGAKRSFALGGFLENKVRFIRLGTRDTSLMKKNIPLENRQFIKRESRQDEDLIDIGRIKSAISALSKEVSTLKNKLELVMSIIDKKEIQ